MLLVASALELDVRADLRDLLLLLLVSLFYRGALALLLFLAGGVATVIQSCFSVLKLERLGRRAVEEISVVRDDQHRLFIGREEALKPLESVNVEMVRRLVEHQNIGLGGKKSRKSESRVLSARESLDLSLDQLLGEAKAQKHAAASRAKLESALGREAAVQLVQTRGQSENVLLGDGSRKLVLADRD